MHTTVRNGKSTRRWAFDQGSGGYQGMEVNADPGGTNAMPPGQEPQPGQGQQRAAELDQGAMDIVQRLQEKLQDDPEGLDLVDSLASILMGPSAHAAMSGSSAPPGRPSAAPAQDTPPAFRGVPRTGARDAPYRAMATDQRPRGTGPGGAIMAYDTAAIEDVCRRGRAGQAARTSASIEKRFPGALGRLKRAF